MLGCRPLPTLIDQACVWAEIDVSEMEQVGLNGHLHLSIPSERCKLPNPSHTPLERGRPTAWIETPDDIAARRVRAQRAWLGIRLNRKRDEHVGRDMAWAICSEREPRAREAILKKGKKDARKWGVWSGPNDQARNVNANAFCDCAKEAARATREREHHEGTGFAKARAKTTPSRAASDVAASDDQSSLSIPDGVGVEGRTVEKNRRSTRDTIAGEEEGGVPPISR